MRCATATAPPWWAPTRSARAWCRRLEPLSNGGYLDLTVANYYLPSGNDGTASGPARPEPDIKAEDDPKTKRDEALPVALDELVRRAR